MSGLAPQTILSIVGTSHPGHLLGAALMTAVHEESSPTNPSAPWLFHSMTHPYPVTGSGLGHMALVFHLPPFPPGAELT